jgi:K+-sensing histidine kinase KdpD
MHAGIASVVSCLIAAFYFYTPKFSIHIDDPVQIAELGCFCVVALMTSKYVGERQAQLRCIDAN